MKKRTAKPSDYRVGLTLFSKTGGWTACISEKYGDEKWNARCERGSKVVFESEASCYWIEIK